MLPSPISSYDDIVMADFGLNMIVIDGGIKFLGKINFYPKTKMGLNAHTGAKRPHQELYGRLAPKQLGVLPHITHINVNPYIINLVHAITIN